MTIPRDRDELRRLMYAEMQAGEGRLRCDAASAVLKLLDELGLVIVPREATAEMADVGKTEADNQMDSDWSSDADGNRYDYNYLRSDAPAAIYKAMLAASPFSDPQP